MSGDDAIRYKIYDPTGNITALVETPVDVARQPDVAARIMAVHPQVEQVGYVRESDALPELRMAGGEFCGNATMCAAAWYARRIGLDCGQVTLSVSGAGEPVEVRLEEMADQGYAATVRMPRALVIETRELSFEGRHDAVPLVCMEGISHIVVERGSAFWELRNLRNEAEQAVRSWCESLGVDGLGLMFVDGEGERRSVVPLVYVPASATVFWENSCASGSAAVAMYVAVAKDAACTLHLEEPGGMLVVRSQPDDGETWLTGHVRQVSTHLSPRRAYNA
ncbi:MAG: hypothetical protein IKG18_05955 [Atopobiaceae bacterium]|nr:hypothetical protein [Atopobiaceae bacterium]